MQPATTIQEVIGQIDAIISWSKARQSPLGYFAMLYRRMTVAVSNGIKDHFFVDGARMEQLDTVFANRYLQAWDLYTRQLRCSNAWYTAFEAGANTRLVVLQHLVLGINAHINLDLGIAAASIAPGDKILLLQNDFDKINDIISSLTQAVQDSLSRIWPPLRALENITGNGQDAVLNFSITTARKTAWANAVALAFMQGDTRDTHINAIDAAVVTIANRIIHPGMMTEMILSPVHAMENTDVSKNIDLLAN